MSATTLNFVPPGPVAAEFLNTWPDVSVILGPVGSGKTSAAVMKLLIIAAMQPQGPGGIRRSRFCIIRNTFRDLKAATLKSWQEWMPPQYGKVTMGSPIIHVIRQGDLECEVQFFPLDSEEDAQRLRSIEATAIWFDEASEIPKPVIDAALGRVGRYPSARMGGCRWSGLILSSNMASPDSWLYSAYEKQPQGWKFFIQPSGLSDRAENLLNLPNGRRYYERLAASADPDWTRRFIHAEWVHMREGKPVYPAWRDETHCAPTKIEPVRELGVILGMDFGLTPACVFMQQLPDGRVIVFDELVADDAGLVRFSETLTRYWRTHYSDMTVAGAFGDPAGTARSQDTERTAFDVLNAHTPWKWKPAPSNEISIRTEAVSMYLTKMIDGRPAFTLSPKCSVLRKGFNGGYHFAKVRSANGDVYHETPAKTAESHPHDALQYGVLGLAGVEPVFNRQRSQRSSGPQVARDVDYPLFGDSSSSGGMRVVSGPIGSPTNPRPSGQASGRIARGTDWEPF